MKKLGGGSIFCQWNATCYKYIAIIIYRVDSRNFVEWFPEQLQLSAQI